MNAKPTAATLLARLSAWFQRHCNDDWEHEYGITIKTCDNPGWIVRIDLPETPLAEKPFVPVLDGVDEEGWQLDDESPWLHCIVDEGAFQGAGDPTRLEEILETFLAWADA
ncbi:MAG: immunity 53 family protein [Pirellulales bacterium]|nr:immunity 53 family protein [Pirellulales bacterium]